MGDSGPGVPARPQVLTRRGFLAGGAVGAAALAACAAVPTPRLWATAWRRGVVYGSSAATWQLADADYAGLFRDEAAILLTEDDLLWYRIRPTLRSGLVFTRPDRIVRIAEMSGQLVFGAHLVWDQGFGTGWSRHELWNLDRLRARRLLFGTVDTVVRRYRGRIAAWSCANEVIAASTEVGAGGLRTDVPWYRTCGNDYVATAFHVAHEADPAATLVLNDFGYETASRSGPEPAAKQRVTLQVLDTLLAAGVPVHAFGLQAHLFADQFADRFAASTYQGFLRELSSRGVRVMITELDVLDDGLPADVKARDQAVAEVYRRYLDTVLGVAEVSAVLTFGLSDRYTWLQQTYPRRDGAARRPLPFDARLRATPARAALQNALAGAQPEHPWRQPPRASRSGSAG
jgi:endo-1,4-beta-xylanase